MKVVKDTSDFNSTGRLLKAVKISDSTSIKNVIFTKRLTDKIYQFWAQNYGHIKQYNQKVTLQAPNFNSPPPTW